MIWYGAFYPDPYKEGGLRKLTMGTDGKQINRTCQKIANTIRQEITIQIYAGEYRPKVIKTYKIQPQG